MPVQRCIKDGKEGWKWGKSGKCYIGEGAKAKAAKQGAAIKASGYKENQMLKLTANFTGNVRHDSMEGRDYLVAPMIMMVEGVLDGSGGPILYPADEMAKTPVVWNAKPVIVYHPKYNGQPISACDPDILTNRKIGVIMNTTFEDGKLKAEAWMEINRMNAVDDRIMEAVENNKIMELSTGLFTDNESQEGEFNGKTYQAIARNFRPDHLALLPDLKGACSVEDGAGFLRLNVDMSFGETSNLLSSLLRDKLEDAYVESVYDDFFIYENDGALFKQLYVIKEGGVEFADGPQEVIRVVEYRTKDGTFVANFSGTIEMVNRKEIEMDKKVIVDGLITNETTHWDEKDREKLMKIDKGDLEKMVPIVNETEEKVVIDETATEEKVEEKRTDKQVDIESKVETNIEEKKPTTLQECITTFPLKIQRVLINGIKSYEADVANVIEKITANEKNTFTKEQLMEKDLEELRQIAVLAEEDNDELVTNLPNYGGQAPVVNRDGYIEEPLLAPTVNDFVGAKEDS